MKQARLDSIAAYELELMKVWVMNAETLALKKGDRVFLLTIEGDYPSVVTEDWNGEDLLVGVKVTVDCGPSLDWKGRQDWIELHRNCFRAFSILDLMAES